MKVFITGGATWVKIDEVRILTSVFTGRTAVFLADKFRKKGDRVTLAVNPARISPELAALDKSIDIKPFYYFEELRKILKKELTGNSYDAVIHNAAVSDYLLNSPFKGKFESNKKQWNIKLSPAVKLISLTRNMAKQSILVQFKLEANGKYLIDRAVKSMEKNNSDMVVANALSGLKEGKYRAFILDRQGIREEVPSKNLMAERLRIRIEGLLKEKNNPPRT